MILPLTRRLALIALAILVSVYGIVALVELHDARNADKFALILKEQEKRVTILKTLLSDREAQWAEENRAQQALIAKLGTSIAQRDVALVEKKKENATLSAAQASAKLAQQTGASDGQVKPVDDGVLIELPIAIRVMDTFDSFATLQQNYTDVQEQFAAQQDISRNLQADVDQQKEVIAALDVQITDGDRAHKAELSAVKAQARKGKMKWFVIGAIVGAIGRGLLGL